MDIDDGTFIKGRPEDMVFLVGKPDLIIERLDPSVPMPKYAREGDSGFDLHLSNGMRFGPGRLRTRVYTTGIRCHIPEGYELQIRPRSSISKAGILTHFGTVDCGYRGEIKVTLTDLTGENEGLLVKGDRIAQAVLVPVVQTNIVEGVVNTDTERGEAGFGSTGR